MDDQASRGRIGNTLKKSRKHDACYIKSHVNLGKTCACAVLLLSSSSLTRAQERFPTNLSHARRSKPVGSNLASSGKLVEAVSAWVVEGARICEYEAENSHHGAPSTSHSKNIYIYKNDKIKTTTISRHRQCVPTAEVGAMTRLVLVSNHGDPDVPP